METPYTVASLSRPLDGEHGKIHAAAIHSFRGLKKRKRHEVVVGVDGESLSIYNIQAQSLIASYAIPPQTYLCCAPCSTYIKKSSAGPAQRYTYAALSDGHGRANHRIVRFVESLGESASFAAPVKSEVKLRGSPFALEALPSTVESSQQAPAILVTYPNGDCECIDTTHDRVQWTHDTNKRSQIQIECATAVDSETAGKGILKNRDDIVASLATSNLGTSVQLYRIARKGKDLSLQIFRLRASALQLAGGTFSGMDLLDTVVLSSGLGEEDAGICEVNAASGFVYRLAGGKLTIWNLTESLPHIQSVVGDDTDPIVSFARTSLAHVLAVTSSASKLYDVKFGSVQGTSLRRPALDAVAGKKRKRQSELTNDTPYYLVSSFSDLGLAVAVDGHELVAFNLTHERGNIKRAIAGESLLIDAVGKSQASRGHAAARSSTLDNGMDEWTAKVDELIKQDDIEGLEDFVDQDLGIRFPHSMEERTVNGVNGNLQHYRAPWQLDPNAYDSVNINKTKAEYLLKSIFSPQSEHDRPATGKLRLRIPARNLIRWLAASGILHQQQLSRTLNTTVEFGSITNAIGLADDSFQLLQDFISLSIFLSAAEVTSALALLIDSLDTHATDLGPLALPASTHDNSAIDASLEDAASTFESESRAAEKELGHAFSALQTGLDIRSQCFRLLFARLRALPTNEVRAAFRQHLSHRNLVFFIQMLRVELAEGGWTSRYIDVGNDEYANRIEASEDRQQDSRGPSDQALRHIGQLLTCAIDAVGMNGWLVGLSGDAELTQEILDSIRAEVSASLEGCLEAQTLERFLGELERYADDVARSHPRLAQGKYKRPKAGATELPLGCRYEKARANGRGGKEGQRSVLEIARERDARVGKYSVDRIRV